jgi:hypothetical protein
MFRRFLLLHLSFAFEHLKDMPFLTKNNALKIINGLKETTDIPQFVLEVAMVEIATQVIAGK